jgi:hypothetical protein
MALVYQSPPALFANATLEIVINAAEVLDQSPRRRNPFQQAAGVAVSGGQANMGGRGPECQ